MNIGIIGSGNIGSGLAKYMTQLGHEVLIANSRGPESLRKVATETCAKAVTAEVAAGARDIVIISVPEKAIPNLPLEILARSNAVIVDTGNYYPSRDGANPVIEAGLTDSEWVSKIVKRSVVKAFNNIVAPSLVSRSLPAGDPKRIAISVAGENAKEKQIVMKLIDSIGFDAIDAGALSDSWRQQPGTPAYCQDLNKEALKSALQAAEVSKREAYLATADEQARPYF